MQHLVAQNVGWQTSTKADIKQFSLLISNFCRAEQHFVGSLREASRAGLWGLLRRGYRWGYFKCGGRAVKQPAQAAFNVPLKRGKRCCHILLLLLPLLVVIATTRN